MKRNRHSIAIHTARLLIVYWSLLIFFISPSVAMEAHQSISGPLASIEQVTAACLSCHPAQGNAVLQSSHWKWSRTQVVNGQLVEYGKKESLAFFAVPAMTNKSRCMTCHVAAKPQQVDLETADPTAIDCLICHDTTGSYQRANDFPANQPNDLTDMARRAGRSTPANCGACHFQNCGFNNGEASATPRHNGWSNDTHMAGKIGFTCQKCHNDPASHSFSAKTNLNSSGPDAACRSCHSPAPHLLEQLNRHGETVACQSCHIPYYAQNNAEIVSWDWVAAGKSKAIKQQSATGASLLRDRNGMTFATNLEPVYLWDDGTTRVYMRGDRIEPDQTTILRQPTARNPKSRLMPFRVIYGTQPYDQKYRYLISPILDPGRERLFPASDWNDIARRGMEAFILPYSGTHDFTQTVDYQRLNHGIGPAESALDCLDCHGQSGRLNWQDLGYPQDPWKKQ